MDVNLHAKAKHWGLMAYMDILASVMSGKKRILKYIDLYCGDGVCNAIIGKNLPIPQKESWDAPPFYAVKKWNSFSDFSVSCIFNDNDSKKIEGLKALIAKQGLEHLVEGYYSENADLIAKTIIRDHLNNPEYASLIYLDPYKHSQLSWDTIEAFASVSKEESYYGEKFQRRPELIITLMTYSMYRSYKQRPDEITHSLGTTKWKKRVSIAKKNNRPVYVAFYDTFLEQLQQFYPKEGIFSIQVKHLKNPGMNYFLFYAMSHPLAIKIFSKGFFNSIRKFQEDDLVGEYLQLIDQATGMKPLDTYFKL